MNGPAGAPTFERYAIYWAPPADSALAAFGRSWLGIDERDGSLSPAVETFGLDRDFAARITAEPRRYALHGTLKAPFRLASACTVEALTDRLRRFCGRQQGFCETRLALSRAGTFLALMPASPTPLLDRLALMLTVGLDEFRAPMDASDRARRRIDRLEPAERLLLEDWGYPYVFDRFRFHVTLTTGLDPHDQIRVERVLSPALAGICQAPLVIDDVCLFGDPGHGLPFRLIERFSFGHAISMNGIGA